MAKNRSVARLSKKKQEEEEEDDFISSDEDTRVNLKTTKTKRDIRDEADLSDDFDDDDDDEDAGKAPFLATSVKKNKGISRAQERQQESEESEEELAEEDEEDDEVEEEEEEGEEVDEDDLLNALGEEDFIEDELAEDEEGDSKVSPKQSKASKKLGKLKNLTPEQLLKEQKRIKKTGVCYLSRIPPFMKPAKLRSVLSRFGEIDRLFLKPEDSMIYQKRVKYGGNKKKNFTEGWVEFINKKDAKLCEASMNGQIIGGKKTSYYYDDVMNIKYLSGFKWMDLTQQIAKENEIRQAKLSMEVSQQQKLNKSFVSNVEKSKMVKNIQQKRKAKEEKESENKTENKDVEMRRNFKQRKIASTRADADDKLKERAKPNEKLNDVLSRVF